MIKAILTTSLVCLTLLAFSQSPGGVSSQLKLWLKADSGVEEANADPAEVGDNVVNWLDQSGNSNDFTHSSGSAPVFRFSDGRYVVDFSGGSAYLHSDSVISGTGARTMILVLKPTALSGSSSNCAFQLAPNEAAGKGYSMFVEAPSTNSGLACRVSGNRIMDHTTSTTIPSIISIQNGASENVTATEFYVNGTAITTQLSAGAAVLNTSTLGCAIGGFSSNADNIPENTFDFNGDIAEIIVYADELTNANRNAIETYLNIRYGILIPVASHNKYTHGSFSHAIAGIGRDQAGQGFTKDSGWSIEPNVIFSMYNPSSLGDGDYLVWGHDSGATSFVKTNIPASVDKRIERIWRVSETNEVGTTTLKFYIPGLIDCGSPIPASDFKLLVDNVDTDFTNASLTSATTYRNDTVYFTGVNLANNDHFTVGVANVETPANVDSSLVLWLKANCGVEEASNDPAELNDNILNWLDHSGLGNHATNSAGIAPVYKTDGGDSAIDFSGGSAYLIGPSVVTGTGGRTMIVVGRPTALANATGNSIFTLEPNNTAGSGYSLFLEEPGGTNGLALRVSGNRVMNHSTSTTEPSFFVVQNGNNEQVSQSDFFVNGQPLTQQQSLNDKTLNTGSSGYIAGGFANGGSLVPNAAYDFNGFLHEVIVYDRELSCEERNQIELYLAHKYSIEIDGFDETSTGSNGLEEGVVGLLKGYGAFSDVTTATSGGATVTNVSFLSTPGDKLFIAHNGGSGSQTTDVPGGIDRRASRVWFSDYSSCSANAGNITLSIDLSSLVYCGSPSALATASNYRLLTSATSSFAGATATAGATIVGTALQFTVNATLLNDRFFTIATADESNSPLWDGGLKAPEGITNGIQLWLRGDCGVEEAMDDAAENGDDVTAWRDASNNGNDMFQNNGSSPSFAVSGGVSSVDFSGGSEYLEGEAVVSGTTGRTVFVVTETNALSTRNVPISLAQADGNSGSGYAMSAETVGGTNGLAVRVSGNRVMNHALPTGSVSIWSTQMNTGENVTDIDFFVNGESIQQQQSSSAAAINSSALGVILGGWSTDGDLLAESIWDFDGSIHEVIVYNRELNCAERNQIEQYLANKYNVTLHYDASEALGDNGINTDPAMIRDGSTSATSSALTTSNTTFITDCTDTLWFAHNNLSGLTAKANDTDMTGLAGTDVKRWTRHWYGLFVSNSSDAGNVTLTFDLDNYPASAGETVAGADYRLITSASPWQYANTVSGPTIDVAQNTVAFVVDADDIHKKFFTLATTNNVNSPLPVSLVSFVGYWSKGHVQLEWETLAELNSDYFEVERSADGKDWQSVQQVAAKGNSNQRISYAIRDENPLEGRSYYRLTQYDINGSFTTFPIVTVTQGAVAAPEGTTLYPNPTSGEVFVNGSFDPDAAFWLTNAAGEKIAARPFLLKADAQSVHFNFETLKPGVYILEIDEQQFRFVLE